MTEEEKVNSFKQELILISDPVIREFATKAVTTMPDYFFTMAASTTGKYHPKYALGEGGLLRHTRGMIKIAIELMRMESWNFTKEERDLILASMILHDGWKLGDGKTQYTSDMHPLFASDALKFNKDIASLIPESQLNFICDNISSHMGQWHFDKSGKDILPQPVTQASYFVHLCDYLASRKCIEINFDA